MRVLVFTANYGQKDYFKELEFVEEGFEYLYFSDNKPDKVSHWNYRHSFVGFSSLGQAKALKLQFPLSNPLVLNYDYVVYLDANIVIKKPIKELITSMNKSVLLLENSYRNNIIEEIKACSNIGKYKEIKGLGYIKKHDIPTNEPMPLGGFYIIKTDAEGMNFLKEWTNNLNESGMERDQLSLAKTYHENKTSIQMIKNDVIEVLQHKIDKLYNKEYYADRMEWKKNLYPLIANTIKELLKPESVIDFGAGNAEIVNTLNSLGIPSIGIEGSTIACSKNGLLNKDLRNQIILEQDYDLGISIEVAEHIEPRYEHNYLTNLTRYSKRLFFTASNEEDGGVYHFNCKPKSYWVRKLSELGFEYDAEKTELLIESMKTYIPKGRSYLYENLMYFEKVVFDDGKGADYYD